jgi:hypothetical protein
LLVDEFVLSLQDLVQVQEGGVDGGLQGRRERGREEKRGCERSSFRVFFSLVRWGEKHTCKCATSFVFL